MGPTVTELFRLDRQLAYFDTATYGLPPRPTVEVMDRALRDWETGSAYWVDDWDVHADRARVAFARLNGIPDTDVAMIPAVSVGVGLVAAALTAADRVVVPDDEFTSLLFPLLVAAERGTTVEQVPFIDLPEHISTATTLVATSLVQMQTGRVAPLADIVDRARDVGARVLVDASHALPFVGGNGALADVDFTVCAGYKHLLCPRGVAFLVVRGDRHGDVAPWNANWRAATDPYGRFFGGPLTLGEDARRFDVSVPWFPWLGAAVSLELLCTWSEEGLLAAPLDHASDLAAALGVEWHGATLVCAPVDDVGHAREALARGGIKAALRGDAVRLSTHVYTTDNDIHRAVEVIRPLVSPP